MFGRSRNKKNKCPVDDQTRRWIDDSMLWLFQTFGDENIKSRKILTPTHQDFPFNYDGGRQAAFETLKIVAEQMEINPEEIHLDIYQEGQTQVGDRIFLQQVEGEKYSGGLYWGKSDNKYHIGLEEKKLNQPIEMIATLAHEFSHIKLLGEKRIEKNNEQLTDLTTVVFGLGIFNANVAFQTKNNFSSWGWSRLGYLSQMEWGYALAVFAYFRGEISPPWIRFLSTNVKSDFKKSEKYIQENRDKVFTDETDR